MKHLQQHSYMDKFSYIFGLWYSLSIDLPTDGPAQVDLTLTCNTTHLLYNADIVAEGPQYYYSYFLAIDCLDANGSQVSYMYVYNVDLDSLLM